jgi:NADP-reducing hydrogenase subunit HndB
MAIKSLDELKKIREDNLKKVNLRESGTGENKVELLVGMATCGIASGARKTMNKLIDELDKRDIDNVKVIQVGCMGYCHSEPTVQVNVPGQDPILYGPVTEDRVDELIEKHLINHEIIEELVINKNFDKA